MAVNLWDWKARSYDLIRRLFPFNLILLKELRNISELLSETNLNKSRILDVATGTGTILKFLPTDCHVFGMDSSRKMLNQAQAKGHQDLVRAKSTALPFKTSSFQLVTAIGVFEYQQTPLSFLNEMHRVTGANGFLLLTYSQLGLLNVLRNLLGQRVYVTKQKTLEPLLHQSGYAVKQLKQSLIQTQLLLYKSQNIRDMNTP
ncbi:class I SAM-dependent methyltransferase [candidate division KSB1 bacterium]|nr:class I SAM-dependent methyltransferase [candidate division KSB1 bacterium]NIR70563.1 class I SAM-dependent methyltransferase [candidate division KSB1 bacterium]NIS26006.1 class I SAM-dependent methyltransferase [candidate division KSB1 bacterium]NIT72828.1 class I SAM-dependent methyltransferase [candidate division KSB1 bacterium]NIU26671.1 class I SAM-dependent methyltransferase [candidate division KSB1 bacterium]